MLPTSFLVLAFATVLVLSNAIRILKEYERAVVFRLGRTDRNQGPGLILLIPIVDRMVQRRPAHDHHGRAAAGRHHARQRLGEGERGGLLPRRSTPSEGDHRGRALPLRHHASSRQTTLRTVLGEAELDELLASARDDQRATCRRSSTSETEAWGIKVLERRGEARRSAARRCSARWPSRPRPSASGGREVINAEGEFQAEPAAELKRPTVISQEPDRAPAPLSTDPGRGRDREQLDHHLPGADRSLPSLPHRGNSSPSVKRRGDRAQIRGRVTSRCPGTCPSCRRRTISQSSSLSKKSTWAMPSLA